MITQEQIKGLQERVETLRKCVDIDAKRADFFLRQAFIGIVDHTIHFVSHMGHENCSFLWGIFLRMSGDRKFFQAYNSIPLADTKTGVME